MWDRAWPLLRSGSQTSRPDAILTDGSPDKDTEPDESDSEKIFPKIARIERTDHSDWNIRWVVC
jgi:hypothetical protein